MKQDIQISPFTEMPEELKQERPSLGKWMRGFFNILFLVILGLALLALVLAFAYQLIYHPDEMGAWANSLITSIQNFIQSLIPAAQ